MFFRSFPNTSEHVMHDIRGIWRTYSARRNAFQTLEFRPVKHFNLIGFAISHQQKTQYPQ